METEQDIKTEKIIKPRKKDDFAKAKNNLTWNQGLDRYQKIDEIQELIPEFQKFYIAKKIETLNTWGWIKIIKEYQLTLPEGTFFCPYPTQYKNWRVKWDEEYLRINGVPATAIGEKKLSKKELMAKTEAERSTLPFELPTFEELEDGANILAGQLIKDASQVLTDVRKQDQGGKLFFTKEMIQRRNYVMNVMKNISKITQGKETIQMKKDQGKVAAAGFIFNLLKSSTAGKISKENMDVLRSTIIPKQINS